MKKVKVDNSGQAAATQANAEALAAANNLRQNMAVDLTSENLTTAVAGGTADAGVQDVLGSSTRKRKATGGLATQLGVNV